MLHLDVGQLCTDVTALLQVSQLTRDAKQAAGPPNSAEGANADAKLQSQEQVTLLEEQVKNLLKTLSQVWHACCCKVLPWTWLAGC